MEALKKKIELLLSECNGSIAIVVEDLDKGKKIEIKANDLFPAKSIIKVPIMAALFKECEKGNIDFSNSVTIKKVEMVGGSGVLQCLSPGTKFTINDLITLMIIQSDNTATNILIDLVGYEVINEMMNEAGMINSNFDKKLMIYPANTEVENYITANDCALLLNKMSQGKLVSYDSSCKMINILKMQQRKDGVSSDLPNSFHKTIGVPPTWEFANKTGWDDYHQHDTGILYANQRSFIVSALSKNNTAKDALDILAKLGKTIYQFMYNVES